MVEWKIFCIMGVGWGGGVKQIHNCGVDQIVKIN